MMTHGLEQRRGGLRRPVGSYKVLACVVLIGLQAGGCIETIDLPRCQTVADCPVAAGHVCRHHYCFRRSGSASDDAQTEDAQDDSAVACTADTRASGTVRDGCCPTGLANPAADDDCQTLQIALDVQDEVYLAGRLPESVAAEDAGLLAVAGLTTLTGGSHALRLALFDLQGQPLAPDVPIMLSTHASPPVVTTQGVVYVTGDGGLWRQRPPHDPGRLLLTQPFGVPVAPLADEEIAAVDQNGLFCRLSATAAVAACFDLAIGAVASTAPVFLPESDIVLVAGRQQIVAVHPNAVAADEAAAWRLTAAAAPLSQGFLVHEPWALLGLDNGTLLTIDTRDGTVIQTISLASPTRFAPVLTAEEDVIVIGADRNVYRFGPLGPNLHQSGQCPLDRLPSAAPFVCGDGSIWLADALGVNRLTLTSAGPEGDPTWHLETTLTQVQAVALLGGRLYLYEPQVQRLQAWQVPCAALATSAWPKFQKTMGNTGY